MENQDISFRIVPMTKEHVGGAVEMHLLAFRGFFLAMLGRGFLREFYKMAAGHEQTVGYVAVDPQNNVVGACFGLIDSGKFFKEILKKRWWAFILQSIIPAVKKPVIIPRLFRALRHRGNLPPCDIHPLGALQSTAVRPDSQALGIAIALMRSVCDEYVRRGVKAVFLTTDAENNDRVRGFYETMGWKLLGYYTTPEHRKMCWYLWKDSTVQ
jgi:ribosomal protein S18 acetylase RimI-like enzyme